MVVLIDNGHGQETPGKRSPDGRLREWVYAREIALRLEKALKARGYDAERIVTEENDIPLNERVKRANKIYSETGKKAILVSIHCNAAGADGKWHEARGWAAYVSRNASPSSKALALCLISAAKGRGLAVRECSPRVPYWTQDLAICRDTRCPAVLTENLFMDNREDVDWLLGEEGRQSLAALHAGGIIDYIGRAGR